ncbi:unnamed protein product [Chilo suppressalis]|uniref:Uncharacterized protein n=1 Tax=Chilo suppressalis TaxID=168631 RepID=A0ABN8L6Y3_CHISP|nr:unnamed protein product [Chilo suppressalis]
MCRKISQVVEFEMNGMPPDSRVIRGCGWDESSYKVVEFEMNGMSPDNPVFRGCGWNEISYKVVEFEMNEMPSDSRVNRGCEWDESSNKYDKEMSHQTLYALELWPQLDGDTEGQRAWSSEGKGRVE